MVSSVMLAIGEFLPDALRFLHAGWWVAHLIAIPVVFLIGYSLGKKGSGKSA